MHHRRTAGTDSPGLYGAGRHHRTSAKTVGALHHAGSAAASSLPNINRRGRVAVKSPVRPVATSPITSPYGSSGRTSVGGRSRLLRPPAISTHYGGGGRRSSTQLPRQLPADRGKLTVVLDVDETLVHSRISGSDVYRQTEDRKSPLSTNSCEDFEITLSDGETIWVNKRPGLMEFLELVAQKYEPIVYTAALEDYAKPLLDRLDPENKIFRHRMYRDSCLFMRGYYVKDLSRVNRDLTRTVLVDNNAFCFLPQLNNGIPVSSFYDDVNDTALTVLTNFLERLEGETDVRPFLRKAFNLETLLKEHRDQIMGPSYGQHV